MEESDKKEIQRMVDLSVEASYSKRVGDTPTDALQLVPKKYVDDIVGGSYAGYVNENLIGNILPTGWSATNPTLGTYTITHNLGTTSYSVVASSDRTDISYISNVGSNSFTCKGVELGNINNPAAIDIRFMLKLL